ncbi:hypothetical protein [Maribacter sp. MAR_2009_72]|uniref:hypothetical protein n=1 Tax=Maribacter sp. MAR_2009_72 TaxID=1250050 RepID=UPI0011A2D07C|nr:hypothetical protein [Maribacter sp. MAR_2009_72]
MKISVHYFLCVIMVVTTMHSYAQQNLQTIGELPSEVLESSGLLFFNGHLITHNDSGNEPVLYELDTLNLSVVRTVTVTNVENTDWEAITEDGEYIYIGDFGNNVGTRTDLAIHRIAKSDFLASDEVQATTIFFSYADQIDFSDSGNSDWDAEAFFVLNDELIILTKQWQSMGSVAYAIPKFPGNHVAERVGAIENIGLVTDATFNSTNNTLVILGYSSILSPFIGTVDILDSQDVLSGLSINSLGLNFVQAEGITNTTSGNYFFTSEYFSRQSPTIESSSRLFSFQLIDEEPEEPEIPEEPEEPETPEEPEEPETPQEELVDQLIIYKDDNSNIYHYSITTTKDIYGQIIYNVLGQRVWENLNEVEKEGVINVSLETSIYYMAMYLEDGVIAKPFAVFK